MSQLMPMPGALIVQGERLPVGIHARDGGIVDIAHADVDIL